jgi:hypothetical protein
VEVPGAGLLYRRSCHVSRSQRCDAVHLMSIQYLAIVLARRGLLSVAEETRTGDVVGNADLGVTQASVVFLSHISARAIEAVCLS